jgi:hypothetical protein
MSQKFKKNILIILVGERIKNSVKIQRILTKSKCTIRTRLGIHDGTPKEPSNKGLIILDIMGKKEEMHDLNKQLDALYGVKTEFVSLAI